jgi:hypothetical protein
MSNDKPSNIVVPILRLRPPVLTELINPRQTVKQPDGPWIAYPGLILDLSDCVPQNTRFAPDITKREYRKWYRNNRPSPPNEDWEIVSVIDIAPPVNMQRTNGRTNDEIASALERYYVGAHQ